MLRPTMTTLPLIVSSNEPFASTSNMLMSPILDFGVSDASAHTAQLAYRPCCRLMASNRVLSIIAVSANRSNDNAAAVFLTAPGVKESKMERSLELGDRRDVFWYLGTGAFRSGLFDISRCFPFPIPV